MDAARKVACRLRLVGAGADHDEACPARASLSSERAPARERQHLSWGCALGGCRDALWEAAGMRRSAATEAVRRAALETGLASLCGLLRVSTLVQWT
jgi:hypothetical protein